MSADTAEFLSSVKNSGHSLQNLTVSDRVSKVNVSESGQATSEILHCCMVPGLYQRQGSNRKYTEMFYENYSDCVIIPL